MTTADANGARVAWTASPESDVIGYRVYRQLGTTGTRTAVTADPVTTTNYLDDGLRPAPLPLPGHRVDSAQRVPPLGVVQHHHPDLGRRPGHLRERLRPVTLNGPWTTARSSQDSGGSFADLSSPATPRFFTTGISWITRRNPTPASPTSTSMV